MPKINVTDLENFNRFINSISKLVTSCKFVIDSKKCEVSAVDENKKFRVFFETDSILSDTKVEFCLSEISKLCSSISTLREFKTDKDNTTILEYDGTNIKLNDGIKFSLKTIKEEVIKRLITEKLKIELDEVYGFTLDNKMMKKLCSMSFISGSSDTHKIYIYKNDNKIIGEVDDKKSSIRDSIGIPISTDFFGSWEQPLITKVDTFRLWNLLDCPFIKISYTKQGACLILNEMVKNTSYIKIKIIGHNDK